MPRNIGIDFGSLGWRAAWQDGEQVIVTRPDSDAANKGGWLLCEPSQANRLGFNFPSVKSRLGQGPAYAYPNGGDACDPRHVVADFFRDVIAAVESKGAGPVGHAVATVPARYSASRRTALREAAIDAGFADVHLLNDSMAAVLSRAYPRAKSATVLVYLMGYAGYELGLVRVARGHYRALGYEGGDLPGGAALDEWVLRAWLATVQGQFNLDLDIRGWGLAEWLRLQRSAQWTKEALSASGQAQFPITLLPAGRGDLRTPPIAFRGRLEQVEPLVQATLERAEKLLADSGLTSHDLDEVLLAGGSTRIPWMAGLIGQRLGQTPLLLPLDGLAQGAALHAARLDAGRPPVSLLTDREEAVASEPTGRSDPVAAMPATLVVSAVESGSSPAEPAVAESSAAAPEQYVLPAIPAVPAATDALPEAARPPAEESPPGGPVWDVLQPVRDLIDKGQVVPARELLLVLIRGAQELLGRLPAAAAPANPGANEASTQNINPTDAARAQAERAITHARRLLREGKRQDAVDQSHAAWALDPNSPEIFDQMIDIHVTAAQAAADIDSFLDARNWLACAYQHDQSNSKVQAAIAERIYLHAKQLAEVRRFADAKAALEQCLHWDPEHEQGRRLQETLTRR